MSMLPGLVALALIGADGDSKPQPAEISYNVRVLDMDSIDWRGTLHHRLKPVARQGTTTVWTTSRQTARALGKRAEKSLAAPKVTAEAGSAAMVIIGPEDRHFVADVKREANGPLHHASRVEFKPEMGTIHEGFRTDVVGRKVDGGVLTRLTCDTTWLTGFHTVSVPEMYVDEDGVEAGIITNQVQIPDVATGHVDGEWLVPAGEVLLVSLGARWSVEAKDPGEGGLDVQQRERLVLVEPEALASPAASSGGSIQPTSDKAFRFVVPLNGATISRVLDVAAPEPSPAPAPSPAGPEAAKPMPNLPSRSLPMARAADGSEIPLPPLPDDQMETASHEESAEPRPTPQARPFGPSSAPPADPAHDAVVLERQPQPILSPSPKDSDAVRTGCDLAPPVEAEAGKPAIGSGTIRIPLGGNLAVEIRATVEPATKR